MEATLDKIQCSRARIARDSRFDGLFFTAVKTTGIYCRPICPARSPKEENVDYFVTAAAASEAGFRPCLRCRPESAPGTPAWRGTETTVSRALTLIRSGALNEGSVEDLADRLGITDRYLRQLFTRHLGTSPLAFAQTQRFHFAKKLLNETDLSITQIALASGFGSIRRFNHVFKQAYGKPPRAYQSKQAEQQDGTAPTSTCRLKLSYRPPYDWQSVLSFFRTRCIPSVERVGETSYSRSFRLGDCRGCLVIRHLPEEHAFDLTVQLDKTEALMSVVERVRRLLDLDANTAAISETLRSDPIMAPLVARFPGTRLPGAWDPFEFSVRAVLGQQISVKAATTIAGRVARRCGPETDETIPEGLDRFFPSAQEMSGADLSGLGLTRKRCETLTSLVEAVANGVVCLEVGQRLEHFTKSLCELPGIGPWTAHYIAMRGLSEPDAFPESDLGIIKALSSADGRISPREVGKLAEAWQPWRAYAAMYLWKSLADPATKTLEEPKK